MKNVLNCFLLLLFSIGSIGQMKAQSQRQITGRVMDEQGELLIGVNVMVEGTTLGTVTDNNGTYTLHVTTPDECRMKR